MGVNEFVIDEVPPHTLYIGESVARAQRALGDLEDAVQRPLTPGDQLPAGATVETLGQRPGERLQGAGPSMR